VGRIQNIDPLSACGLGCSALKGPLSPSADVTAIGICYLLANEWDTGALKGPLSPSADVTAIGIWYLLAKEWDTGFVALQTAPMESSNEGVLRKLDLTVCTYQNFMKQ
jgi:hypothetical protein